MVRWIKATPPGLLGMVRQLFGLSQAEAAALLGVPQSKVAAAEAGTRPLHAPAARRLRALAPLLTAPPAPPPPADWAPVHQRLAACRAQAEELRVRLAHELPARAAAAAARLGATHTLPAALAATEAAAPLTPAQRQAQTGQLYLVQAGATAEWHTRSGPVPAALLAARHAALLAEAAALAQALPAAEWTAGAAGAGAPVAEPAAAAILQSQDPLFHFIPNPNLRYMPTTPPDLSGVKTQRTVDAMLPVLTLKRDVAGARKGTLSVEIQTFGSPESRESEATRLVADIAEAQADLATLTDPKLIGAAQANLGRLFTRQGRLTSQADTRGEDDLELLKYELHITTLVYDKAATYVDALIALRPTLPA